MKVGAADTVPELGKNKSVGKGRVTNLTLPHDASLTVNCMNGLFKDERKYETYHDAGHAT
eukprot:9893877-Heterocapsa_arctica.AAC.1